MDPHGSVCENVAGAMDPAWILFWAVGEGRPLLAENGLLGRIRVRSRSSGELVAS